VLTFALALALSGALSPAAFAALPAELEVAADDERPEAERMAAFQQIVSSYSFYNADLLKLAADQDGDARQRWVTIRILGQVRSDETFDAVMALCDDPMPAIRVAAASALGDLGNSTGGAKLATMLTDEAVIVRAAAADSLGLMREATAIGDLTRALEDPTNYYRGASLWARRHYVDAIGAIGSREGIPTLVQCFDDRDPEVIAASLRALRSIVGYDFAEGRTQEEHIEAWRRWWANGGEF